MPFTRPTLQQIIDRVRSDFRTVLQITNILRRSFNAAITRALAGASHTLHGHMVFISKQIFPDQAEAEFANRWARVYGTQRLEATFTQLNIDVVFDAAATVPISTALVRSDGVEYTFDAELTATGAGTLSAVVTASESGADGNVADGEELSFSSPISDVQSVVTVTSTAVEGEDEENDANLQERLLLRIQEPPAGGKSSDYISWIRGVVGVTRAWVLPGGLGEGTVLAWFVEDDDDPIIPDGAKILEVQTAVNLAKPVTDDATIAAPTAKVVDFTIALKPNTVAVQEAVEQELTDLFRREGNVTGAADAVGIPTFFSGSVPLSKMNEAISLAAGEQDHILTAPSEEISTLTGELLTIGTFTFTTLV